MTNQGRFTLTALTIALLAGCNSDDTTPEVEADTVLYNGTIVTMDGEQSTASSLAIKDGKIVGLNVNSEDYSSEDTQIINLKEQTVVPGFIDAHGHLSMVAQTVNFANLAPSPIGNSDTIALLVNEMQQFWDDKELAEGQWMVGMSYDDSLLAEQRHPTRYDLDQISTEVPIVIVHVSFHLAVVNSKALEVLGIDATTADPDGGKIVRVSGSDEPNGVLEETAMYLAMGGLSSAPQTEDSLSNAFAAAQEYYASFGITTVQEGAASKDQVLLYEQLGEAGELYLDIAAYPTWDAYSMMKLDGYAPSKTYTNNFRIAGAKIVLDGSPQGKTAFMTQPYLNPPAGEPATYVGYPTLTREFLEAKLREYLDKDTQFIVHTNGDASVDMYLAALDAVSTETDDFSIIRPVSIHSQTTRDDQLEEMVKYQMIPSFFSAHTFFWGDWHRDEVFGEERAMRISPTRSASNLGINYTTHNDAPVVDPDIIRLMYNTVNRVTRSGQTLGEEQKATAYEALASVTKNAAYQYFEEDQKGTIEVGKLADLVVLSANPLTIEPEKINTIEVLKTYKEGNLVYTQ
ncbi:N-substituted formamide deformylase [Vibrio sp. B1FLJ16]|uniref:amidohydrolase n=1 Tax=Vibrio sp. B1FLJ16 TaxID=2751178 RepID=UPI0015F3D47E|nr:amidohydrolase [Vibrio sp. B1FLJ16]CAD7804864.1 N-substituted formamide deformylase [Vibrio sp. B1FLJ16]CAE6898341.1 N-substituted formamide deformylase [Vibrio sp. B1FLJ16]